MNLFLQRSRVWLPVAITLILHGARALADTTPPSLISLSASSPVNAPGIVTLTARLTDTGVGVNTNQIYAILLNPQNGGQITVRNWIHQGGDTYVAEGFIGPASLPGQWKVYYLLAYDRNRNGAMFIHGTHHHAGFTVINPNPDGNPPVMSSVSVTPNPGTLNSMATATIVVSDDVSGVNLDALFVNLTHASGSAIGHSQVNSWTMIGANTYQGTTILNPLGEPGPWIVHSVFLRDNAGNAANLMHGVDYASSFQVKHPDVPDIFQHPNNQQKRIGETAVFNVAAVGAPPLFYQWRRNGIDIPGATSPTYNRTVLSIAENGDQFNAVVYNSNGAVTSRTANLRMENGNYQSTIASHAPDVWYRMDNSHADSGALGGSPLIPNGGDWSHGGRFGFDFEDFENLAYYTDSGQDLLYQTNNIIGDTGSISLLIKMPRLPLSKTRHVFAKGTASPTAFHLVYAEPNMSFKLGNVNVTLSNTQPLTNFWYYFGASWNIPSGTLHYAYGPLGGSLLTGSRAVSTTSSAGATNRLFMLANRDFRVWESWYGTNSSPGGLDEVAIWNRTLSPDDLAAQFISLTSPSGGVAFLTHPASQRVPEGATGHFTVDVLGPRPVYYQWMKNGVPIPGATNTELSLTGVTLADHNAQIKAFVSNATSSAMSLPATLAVTPSRIYQQTVLSQLPDYWFPLDETLASFGTVPITPLTSLGNFTSGRLPRGTDNVGGASNAFDIVGGFDHLAQATEMVQNRGSFSMLFRTPNTPFTNSNRHVFYRGGSAANGNSFLMRFSPANLSLVLGSTSTVVLNGQPLQDAWYYFALTWDLDRDDGEAIWHLGPLGQPLQSGVVNLGNDDVLGDGSPLYFGNRGSNQWDNAFREGSATGTLDEIAFWLRELSSEEIQLQHAQHAAPHIGPAISTQPADAAVDVGSPAVFSVVAYGVGPLTYQWLSNGVAFAAATNATLTIASATLGMSNDQYRVMITDNFGSVTSSAATLTVLPPGPVSILTNPVSRLVPEKATGHFTVAAKGLEPIFYQWLKNGTPIPGATNAALALIGVELADDGAQITAMVSNSFNTVTSLPATLSVRPSRIYQQTVLSQLPDYWFPLDETLASFGTKPITNLTSQGSFVIGRLPRGTDNVGNASNAFDIIGGFDHLGQASNMVHNRGSFSMLFRTPNVPIDGPNRHVFYRGGTAAAGNAFAMRFAPANLTLLLGSASTVVLNGQPLQDTWYYFALTWDLDRDDGEATWHLGPLGLPLTSGVVNMGNTDVLGDGSTLYFGNRGSNQFDNALRVGTASGTVDEISFWLRELSVEEIQLQHASHTAPYTGPTITAQPVDTLVDTGNPATFSVTATGIGTLMYQWYSNGMVYAGATNAVLNIPSVTMGMSNNLYRAVVSDNYGAVTSSSATLLVIPPPPNLEETITSLNPEYWFRFNGDFTNSGLSPAADFSAAGTAFGIDAFGNAGNAVRMISSNASLAQADLIGPAGTLTMLFRTPDAPPQSAYLLAQGTNTLTGNALSVVHINSTGLQLRAGNASVLIHPGDIPVSTWYFLALSWDENRDDGEARWSLGKVGGTMNTGALDISISAVIGDGSNWLLGNHSIGGNAPWLRNDGTNRPGSIDEVALWTSELSSASISNLFMSAMIGGPKINVIIGGTIRNGNFDADTSTVDSRNFSVTPFWQNIGTSAPDQSGVATRTNQPYNGTRNAQLNDSTALATGMDTEYIISAGDVFDLSYVWLDGFNWVDASDQISLKLFITDNDQINGTRTDLVTAMSGLSTNNNAYQLFQRYGVYIASGSAAGKRLFVEINGVDGNGNPNGFARVDDFVLIATTPGGGGGMPLAITSMRVAINAVWVWGIEIGFDTQPSKIYTIDWMDSLAIGDWNVADQITAPGIETIWYDTGDAEAGRSSPLELPVGKTRTYRVMEKP